MFVCRSPRACLCQQWLIKSVCFKRIHVDRCSMLKKKWSKNEISSLSDWMYETSAIYGPRIDAKKADKTVVNKKHKATHSVSTDTCILSHSQEVASVMASEYDGSHMVFPCSVSKRILLQTASEDSVEKSMSPGVVGLSESQNRVLKVTANAQTETTDSGSKHNGVDTLFDVTKREGTCGYTWVESPASALPNDKGGNTQNTAAPLIQNTGTSINHDNTVQNIEYPHLSSNLNADSDVHGILGADRKQSLSRQQTNTCNDMSQKSSFDQNILSFPLFASPALTTEAAVLSTRFPSVSAILKATMSAESQLVLARWEQRMIAELGEDGFKEYQKALFANGANFHATIHHYLSGKPEPELALLPANQGHWQSIESVLTDITDIVCLEKFIRHQHLHYCGVLDCIAEYRGEKYVIEWKTSKRRKSSIRETFDNPLQLVAYLGAYNVQPSTSLQVERCLLVIGYEDGNAADIHVMDKWDCMQYWSQWLQRLHEYQTITKSSL